MKLTNYLGLTLIIALLISTSVRSQERQIAFSFSNSYNNLNSARENATGASVLHLTEGHSVVFSRASVGLGGAIFFRSGNWQDDGDKTKTSGYGFSLRGFLDWFFANGRDPTQSHYYQLHIKSH